jgi:ATP-dependent helicase/nuclease subunit B
VPIANRAELELAKALSVRAECLSLVPASDSATLNLLRSEFGAEQEDLDELPTSGTASVLQRLQLNLFRGQSDAGDPTDDQVTVFSAPGEGRECVEIARRVLKLASSLHFEDEF